MTTTAYAAIVRAAFGSNREAVENILARWADSIEECCRRGLRSPAQVADLASTYLSIEITERRVRALLSQ